MEKNNDLLFESAFDSKEDMTEFAIDFSEGDDLLKETLLNLWNNNIRTFACCRGHETSEYYIPSYLAIVIDKYSIDLIENICNKLYPEEKDVSVTIGNINENCLDAFIIYMRGDAKERTLNLMNQYVGLKPSRNNELINNSLYMLEYAKDLYLKLEIELDKNNIYIQFRNQTDNSPCNDFRTLDESIASLYNINDLSHLFIKCNFDELDKIVDILKQKTKAKNNK